MTIHDDQKAQGQAPETINVPPTAPGVTPTAPQFNQVPNGYPQPNGIPGYNQVPPGNNPPPNYDTSLSLDNFSREVSKTEDSDTLVNLGTSIEEILKVSPKTKSDLIFISADMNERDLPFSMLLIVKPKTTTTGGKTVVPYYTVLIASSRVEGFEPQQVQTSTGNLNIPIVASDSLNDALVQERIRQQVVKGIGSKYGKNLELFDTGATCIGENFDAKDFKQVKSLLSDAIVAMDNRLARLSNTGKVFTVATLANSRVNTRATFNHGQTLDTARNPVRTDITLTVTTSALNSNQNRFLGQNRDVVTVGGYIDLINVDRNANVGQYGQYFQPQQPMHAYIPVFVITSIQSQFDLSSDQIVLLAISTVTALAARRNWARALLAQDVNPIHDFGAIGIETPRFASTDGKPTKIELRKLSPAAQAGLINDAVADQLLIDVDVPETGDTGRMLELINGVSSLDPVVRQEATIRLMKAADELSLNHFTPTWTAMLQQQQGAVNTITVGATTKIYNGYYHDSVKGEPADSRNLDHLANVVIRGLQEPAAGRQYDQTFTNGESPDVQGTRRLELQEKILGGAGMITLTGASYRHRINPILVAALDKANRSAGLHIDLANPGYNSHGVEHLSYEQFQGQGLNSQQFQGLYQGVYNNSQNVQGQFQGGRYRG